MADHPTYELMLSYVTNRMDATARPDFEAHLADCESCLQDVFQFCQLQNNFEQVWMHVAPSFAAEESLAELLTPAVPLVGEHSAFVERLEAWRKKLAALSEIGIASVVDVKNNLVSSFQTRLDELQQLGLPGEQELTSEFLGVAGNTGFKMKSLSQSFEIEDVGQVSLQTFVQTAARKISVKAPLIPGPWPQAVLHTLDAPFEREAGFRNPPGADFLLAEFDDIDVPELFCLALRFPAGENE